MVASLRTQAAVRPGQCHVLSVATGSPLTSALRLHVGPQQALLILKGSQPLPLTSPTPHVP